MSMQPKIQIHPDSRGGYQLETEMVIQLPRREVFEFFADALQLEAITPEWLNFSVLTPQPIEMREGLLLDYKLNLHRFPIRWRTEITVWDPPFRFVDTQLRGPYKRWHHEHLFEELDEQTTLVKDRVHYIPRGGGLIHHYFVKPDLLKIFTYRQTKLAEIFASQQEQVLAVASR